MTPSVACASEGNPDESPHPDENARSSVRPAAADRRDGGGGIGPKEYRQAWEPLANRGGGPGRRTRLGFRLVLLGKSGGLDGAHAKPQSASGSDQYSHGQ